MAQYNQDATFPAGNDILLEFEGVSRESDGVLVPSSDILGASFAVTPYEDETTPILIKTLGSGILAPSDGLVQVNLAAADTVGLSGEFTYELRLKTSLGIQTAARGRLTIKYQVAPNPGV